MTDDELEKRIDAACREATARGYRLITGLTLHTMAKRCCPMGAVALLADVRGDGLTCAGKELGRDADWAIDFAFGFDGSAWASVTRRDAYEMGARFRARWMAGEYEAGAE